jgi:hypothetical protein
LPLGALPGHNTARVWVDYSDGLNLHTLLVRHDTTVADVMDSVDSLFTNIASDWYEITIGEVRFAASGSDISFPATWTGSATYGATTMPGVFAPRQFMLLGRTNTGRRARWSIFGFEGSSPDDYRLARVAANIVDDALTVIEAGQTAAMWLGIDGHVPVMYQYADFNFNNHYERLQRG